VWWRQGLAVMPRTIEECDRKLRGNFEGATTVRDGVVLVRKGEIVDVEAWDRRVRTVFDRREEYQYKCRINYIQQNSDKK